MNSSVLYPLVALLLAAGIAGGGYLAGDGVARARTGDRTVTVRGVAEREAKADLAIWPLRLVVTDDDLGRASTALENSVQQTRAFLVRQGLDGPGTEVTLQEFSVQDNRANGGYQGARYVIRQTLVVRSTRVDVLQTASQRVPELVRAGVVLSSGQEYGGGGPTFVFTRLNTLKPPMIAEATARAREGAEQFATDSRSALTGIRRATQGVFEILPRDQAQGISEESQVTKRVRVVTTVEYGLRK
ncbi:MAG: SIMPL domain-containing protein [Gemmatimonadota bacterium]